MVPGFFGAGPDGTLTTLGRGGTDLTATLLARTLGASRVVLWKDVAGILTADPRSVPDARLLPQMHHREAAEVAYFGAKVLHPRALIPLDGSRVALQVRSFLKQDDPGTEVSSRSTLEAYPVKALATIRGQALVNVAQFDESRILMAPLPASEGGWGQIDNGFSSKDDPDYKQLLQLIKGALGVK